MDPCDIAKLNDHRFLLVQDMEAPLVVDYLMSAKIFNDHHVKEICITPTMNSALDNIHHKVVHYLLKYGSRSRIDCNHEPPWTMKRSILWFLEKAFWTVILTTFSVLTITSGRALISRFLTKDTTSSLTLISNQPIALPKGTVCLPTYGFTLEEIFQTGYDTEDEEGVPALIALYDYFVRQNVTKEVFLRNEARALWPRTVMDYLTTLAYIEGTQFRSPFIFSLNYSVMTGSGWIEWLNKVTTCNYLKEDSWNAQFLLENYLAQLHVTVDEIKQAVGQQLMQAFGLAAWYYTLENGKMQWLNLVQNFQIASITSYYACFDIDWSRANVALRSSFDIVDVQMNPSPALKIKDTSQFPGRLLLYDLLGRYGTDMQLNTVAVENSDKNLISLNGRETTFLLSIQAAYQAMRVVRDEVMCTDNETMDMCSWNCRVGMIRNLCNCTPATLPLSLSTKQLLTVDDYCSFAKYNGCLSYSSSLITDNSCAQKEGYSYICLPPCAHTKYDIQPPKSASVSEWPQYSRLNIVANDFTYAYFEIEELYVWTTEEFLGILGGILGLWLGLDFYLILKMLLTGMGIISRIGLTFLGKRNDKKNGAITINDNLNCVEKSLKTKVFLPRD